MTPCYPLAAPLTLICASLINAAVAFSKKLVFVTTYLTTGVSLRSAYYKKVRSISLKSCSFTALQESCPPQKRFLVDLAHFTWRHCVQADVKDCHSRVHNYTLGEDFFVQCKTFFEI